MKLNVILKDPKSSKGAHQEGKRKKIKFFENAKRKREKKKKENFGLHTVV